MPAILVNHCQMGVTNRSDRLGTAKPESIVTGADVRRYSLLFAYARLRKVGEVQLSTYAAAQPNTKKVRW